VRISRIRLSDGLHRPASESRCDTASSEASGSESVLVGSSPITSPWLLRKHVRSEGPLLHRHYPASTLLRPSPSPGLTVVLANNVGGANPPSVPGLPQLPRPPSSHAVLITPVDRIRCLSVASLSTRPSPLFRRVGIHDFTFEACSSFTCVTACQVAHPPCVRFVTRLRSDQLPGQIVRQLPSPTDCYSRGSFPPLVICAVGAHRRIQVKSSDLIHTEK